MEKWIYTAKSRIGNGLFVSRDFDVSEVVAKPTGKIVRAKDVDWDALGQEGYDSFLQTGAWDYLDGRPDPFIRYINHSCDPNLGVKIHCIGESLEKKVDFVAIKPVRKGDEITYDYSTTMFEELDEEPMPCKCGERNCRRVIRDFRFLPKDVQKRYIDLGVVPAYVLGKSTQKVPLLREENKSFRKNRRTKW